ncbi:hypothetical protein C4J94_4972 [Pseudomonas sp. R5-89-07]|nr:hypothetical protein C4J94_4972 [Pseudomonas sp. R5-89-07]
MRGFLLSAKKQLDQPYGPQVKNRYSAEATVRFGAEIRWPPSSKQTLAPGKP